MKIKKKKKEVSSCPVIDTRIKATKKIQTDLKRESEKDGQKKKKKKVENKQVKNSFNY